MESNATQTKGREFPGTVISTKMKDTVIVEIQKLIKHRLYRKVLYRSTTFPAHSAGMQLKPGDKVIIKEVKPISKTKHFIVINKE